MNEESRMDSLMSKHIAVNIGIYFERCDVLAGHNDVLMASSASIDDFNWNYAYATGGRKLTEPEMNAIRSNFGPSDKQFGIWQSSQESAPVDCAESAREVWMSLNWSQSNRSDYRAFSRDNSFRVSAIPDLAMLDVFVDAYLADDANADVGYSGLPLEYVNAYGHGRSRGDCESFVVAAMEGDSTVAIASCAFQGSVGGIYSVAVRRTHRRRGLGRQISLKCCEEAAVRGVSEFFLQTEVDSPVEAMYKSLGFRREFIGILYELSQ